MPIMRPALVLALLAGLALAAPASASPETLKRSVSNLAMAPLDLAVSPVVAARTVYGNLRDVEDTTGVRVFYAVPGYLWTTGVQAGASVIRAVAGVLEFVPGVMLLPFETDMKPLFDPALDNHALVNFETPVLDFKFGIDYTTTPF